MNEQAQIYPISKQIQFKKKSIDFLENLRNCLGDSKKDVLDVLNWSLKDHRHFLDYKKDLNALEFSNLSQEFHFSLKAFKENRVDFNAIKNRFFGISSGPQEKYLKGRGSRNFSLVNLIETIEPKFGPELKQGVLNHLQMSDYIYENPLEKINFIAFEEMYSFLRSHGIKDQFLVDMGGDHFHKVFSENQFGDAFNGFNEPIPYIDYLLREYFSKIDQNSSYKIVKREFGKLIIEASDNEEFLDFFKMGHIGSYDRCLARLGFFPALCKFLEVPVDRVKHITCVHKGAKACLYEVDLTKPLFFLKHF